MSNRREDAPPGRFAVGPGAEFAYNRQGMETSVADGETGMRRRTANLCLAALLAAGAAAFLFALFRKKAGLATLLYARPRGGEREGEFELFIGS